MAVFRQWPLVRRLGAGGYSMDGYPLLFPYSLQDINNLIASQLYEVIPLAVVVLMVY